ncbi:MAG: hypothetical protein QNL04_04475 [SAR324 cluster bacterium]|nr:hypothetical protein [SAR324 cluster bacterium]
MTFIEQIIELLSQNTQDKINEGVKPSQTKREATRTLQPVYKADFTYLVIGGDSRPTERCDDIKSIPRDWVTQCVPLQQSIFAVALYHYEREIVSDLIGIDAKDLTNTLVNELKEKAYLKKAEEEWGPRLERFKEVDGKLVWGKIDDPAACFKGLITKSINQSAYVSAFEWEFGHLFEKIINVGLYAQRFYGTRDTTELLEFTNFISEPEFHHESENPFDYKNPDNFLSMDFKGVESFTLLEDLLGGFLTPECFLPESQLTIHTPTSNYMAANGDGAL